MCVCVGGWGAIGGLLHCCSGLLGITSPVYGAYECVCRRSVVSLLVDKDNMMGVAGLFV